MLRARGICCALDGRPLLGNLDLDVLPGEVVAILGANGAGKSTLLRLLARELAPTSGHIELNNRALQEWSALELARQRAVLPQSESLRFPFEARQVVALGRFPWEGENAASTKAIVDAALRAAEVSHLADRPYTRLSAGERARVQFARVLAQVWEADGSRQRLLLLDEPTTSLDLAHQHSVLAMTRRFAQAGAGVIMVLHDPNLALQYSDRALLLKEGRLLASGRTQDVLSADRILEGFGIEVDLIPRPGTNRHWIAPRPGSQPQQEIPRAEFLPQRH